MDRLTILAVVGIWVNVALAGFIVATNNPSPIAVAPASFPEQFMWAGAGVFALIVLGLYLWTELKSRDFPLLEAD